MTAPPFPPSLPLILHLHSSTRTSSGFFLLLADSIFENFLLALLAESSSYKYNSYLPDWKAKIE